MSNYWDQLDDKLTEEEKRIVEKQEREREEKAEKERKALEEAAREIQILFEKKKNV